MRTRSGLLLALALTASLVTGCGDEAGLEPPAEPRFDDQQVAWAHLRTLHYGDQEFTLPRPIQALAVSDYGFFLRLSDDDKADSIDGSSTWGFYDGETWRPVGGDPTDDIRVSPDGRYAGWVARNGPVRPAGRIREVVVADIARGEPVLRDHSGMGGGVGDDLGDRYEELSPSFLGFDADSTHAFWIDAEGSGTQRSADLASGEVAEPEGDDPEDNVPLGDVVDAYSGQRQVFFPEPDDRSFYTYAYLSPDGAYGFDTSDPSLTVITDKDTGRPIPVDYPFKAQYFGGWLPDNAFYVIGTAKRIEGWDPAEPDTTSGQVVVCRLPAGTCTKGDEVPGLRDVVVPNQSALLG